MNYMAVMKLVTAMNFLGINTVMNALIRSLERKTRRRVPEYDPLCEHPSGSLSTPNPQVCPERKNPYQRKKKPNYIMWETKKLKSFWPASFVQTDVNKNYGHKYLDITNEIQIEEKFDLVLCTNVLEHIFDVTSAIKNLI